MSCYGDDVEDELEIEAKEAIEITKYVLERRGKVFNRVYSIPTKVFSDLDMMEDSKSSFIVILDDPLAKIDGVENGKE